MRTSPNRRGAARRPAMIFGKAASREAAHGSGCAVAMRASGGGEPPGGNYARSARFKPGRHDITMPSRQRPPARFHVINTKSNQRTPPPDNGEEAQRSPKHLPRCACGGEAETVSYRQSTGPGCRVTDGQWRRRPPILQVRHRHCLRWTLAKQPTRRSSPDVSRVIGRRDHTARNLTAPWLTAGKDRHPAESTSTVCSRVDSPPPRRPAAGS